jgi:hypothetical protein
MLKDWAPQLAMDVLRGRAGCLEPLVELLALPLAYQTFLLVVLLGIGHGPVRYWAFAQVLVIVFHVLAAASLSEDFPRNLGALGLVPVYVLWKLAMIPRTIMASRPEMRWIRTGRQR